MSDTKIKTRITIAVNQSLLNFARDEEFDCPTVKEAYHIASFLGRLPNSNDVDTVLIVFESNAPDIDIVLEEEFDLALDKVFAEYGFLSGKKTFAIMSEPSTPSGGGKVRYCGTAELFDFNSDCYKPLKLEKTFLSEAHSTLTREGIQPGVLFRHHSGQVYKALFLTNIRHLNPKYPVTVVYEGANGAKWSKSLENFLATMTLIETDEELLQA